MLVSWNTTRQCHLKCPHCYRDAGTKQPHELSTSEGKSLIDQISQAGFKILIFSGGEPMLRDDIPELTEYAATRGLNPVIGTTGTTLDLFTIQRIKKAGVTGLGISLDSKIPQKHDSFRGVDKCWEQAVRSMQYCAESGLPFQINTTVIKNNYDEIEDITDLAEQLGARAHHIFFLVPTGRGEEIAEEMLTPIQYEKLIKRILKKQKSTSLELKPTCAPQFMRLASQMEIPMRFYKGCLAGVSYCCILPDGEVHPCPYLPITVGNVRNTPFDKIWEEADIFQKLRNEPLKGKCGNCTYNYICGGCRARAYYNSGDIMDEDNWCLYNEGGNSCEQTGSIG